MRRKYCQQTKSIKSSVKKFIYPIKKKHESHKIDVCFLLMVLKNFIAKSVLYFQCFSPWKIERFDTWISHFLSYDWFSLGKWSIDHENEQQFEEEKNRILLPSHCVAK